MQLQEALKKDAYRDFGNVNVKVWAIPEAMSGTQARFSPDPEAEVTVSLSKPSEAHYEIRELDSLQNLVQSQGGIDGALNKIHSWYRVGAPIQNPFY